MAAHFIACLAFVVMLSGLTTPVNGIDMESYWRQINSSAADVQRIIDYVKSTGRHETFNKVAYLGDTFGPRVTGSDELNQVIDYIVKEMENESFANVHKENVTVPVWVRGKEYATMILPRRNQSMPMLGLGSSVGTNGTELVAEVYVVSSFDELKATDDAKIAGKIVVYNEPWLGSYGPTVAYRRNGATEAARKGAVAALVRSVTPFSIMTPHGGSQTYGQGVTEIPVAAITVEDAEMMKRMQDRNETVRVALYMEAENKESGQSYNIVAEIVGTQFPEQVVIFGGHIDSWDIGTGSMDDGGGCVISWQVLSIMKKLGLRPRRTMRVVLWTAEEQGLIGGAQYFQAHNTSEEVGNVSLIMEADSGTFKPSGIGFSGSGAALAIMEQIMSLLNGQNTTVVVPGAGGSSDTGDWLRAGVPGVELQYVDDGKYFYFHHTHADTMTVLDADDLDLCTIIWTTAAYVVANLDELLPRTGDYPPTTAAAPTTATTTTKAPSAVCRGESLTVGVGGFYLRLLFGIVVLLRYWCPPY